MDLMKALQKFNADRRFGRKGALCVALVVTQHAKKGLPLDPDALLTEGGGQVLGLGRGAVQAILARHGISRVLAAEGGRTSRGSMSNMREYVAFLNSLAAEGSLDLDAVEAFWIGRVHEFFAGKPFRIRLDASRGLRALVRDVLAQAQERQRNAHGMQYVGAVLQHLTGAKLECALGAGSVEHNSFSTSDAQKGRVGDFSIGDVAIHVTASPGEALIGRCRENIDREPGERDLHQARVTRKGHSLPPILLVEEEICPRDHPRRVRSGCRRDASGSNGVHNVSRCTREVQSRSCGRELDEYRAPYDCRH